MAFPVTVSVFDIGPADPVSGSIHDPMGHRVAMHADSVLDVRPDGWKGTFLTHLSLQLGALYRIESNDGTTARITVTAATPTENSFDGFGPCPFIAMR